MTFRSSVVALLAALAFAPPLRAQCADGSQPPCRPQRAAPARPVVPIDDRTWIVLPFDNQAHVTELDWLTDASVNLLSMDLSRWSDVHAVDDKRVADFLREVPAARAKQRFSLSDGLGVARRAGAGKLVMGEFLKIGSRTVVSATAYNARNGTRIRSARQETAVLDSLMPLFGKVASDLLGVPPPAGANVGTVGTSRADAYQEYIAGVAALNRFDIAEAKRKFALALTLDTAFALAHYKLAITSIYDEAAQSEQMAAQVAKGDATAFMSGVIDSARLSHASAAARLSEKLPPRERALINGLLAQTKQDYARACDLYGTLARADSSDVEALHGVGECSFRDNAVEYVGGDSLQLRFRSSWNTTLRVLRRALAVDPTYHLAFDHVLDVLSASGRIGCHRDDPALPCSRTAQPFRSIVRRQGDSLLIVPIRVNLSEALLSQVAESQRSPTRRLNLEEARKAAEDWVAAGPREGRAHKTLGRIHLRLGRLEDADREMTEAAALLPHDDYSELPFYRLEIALKRGRDRDVVRLFDSVYAATKVDFMRYSAAMLVGPLVGYLARSDSALPLILRAQAKGASLPPVLMQQFGMTSRIALGIAGDSAVVLEKQLLAMLRSQTTCSAICQTLLGPNWILGLRLPRTAWPGFDSTVTAKDRRYGPAVALAAGDTARLRRAALALDSATREEALLSLPEDGASFVAADAFLILHDTVAALRITRRMLDTSLVYTSLEVPVAGTGLAFSSSLWPRAMLLRADLEAARGDKRDAIKWYRRFLDLWGHADPEFAPLVDRARKAYVALGGT